MSDDQCNAPERNSVWSPIFWVETAKTLGIPFVVMCAIMAGGWAAMQQILRMGESFVARAIAQMDIQTDALKTLQSKTDDNGKMIDVVVRHNETMLEQNQRSLKLQQDICDSLRKNSN